MSLDRLTLSPRRLLVAGGAAAALLALLTVANATRPSGPVTAPPPAAAQPAGAAAPGGTAGADAADAAGEEVAADPETSAGPDDAAVDEATVVEHETAAYQVAADFAAGYAEHHFDDLPSAAVERVRSFVTPELATELGRNSGAAAAVEERIEREERAVAVVQAVQFQGGSVAEGRIDLLVVVRQDVTWRGGSEVRWPTYVLQVVRSDDGWRVARLLP